MSWNLPPGCTDKDVDDAVPQEWESLADYLEDRQEAIWIERTLHEVECLCDELIGKGYGNELKALLDKIYREHWPIVHHYRGEAAE